MAFLKDITLGQYYPGNSCLHRLDPRSKLLTSLILMTGLLVSSSWRVILLQMGICLAAMWLSTVPMRIFARNLKWFAWLFGITFVIHAVEFQLSADFPFVSLTASRVGVEAGALYTLRLGLLIVFAALLTLTTAPVAMTDAMERLLSPLRRLNLPVHEFAFMITLALRFIPILIQEGERIKNAQVSRGASLEGPLFQRVRNMIPMLLPLFISAIRKADDLAVAMSARNYAGGESRTSFTELMFNRADYVTLSLAFVLFSGIVLGRLVSA